LLLRKAIYEGFFLLPMTHEKSIGNSLKVFGIGLNKTGTKTLGACLSTLGFQNKSYDFDLLRDWSSGDVKRIFQASDQYDSFEDWPWPLLYKEFDKRYPEAKFILTLRKDPRTWFESLCRHATRTGPTEARKIVYGYEMPHQFVEEHIAIYNRHQEEVINYFQGRNDKLLTICFEKGDGWPELSGFLGLPVPEVPFPHMNPSHSDLTKEL